MDKRVITVSRQFGSGGRTIGRKAAQKLGIPCYDKELIEKIAMESGYGNEYIEENADYAPSTNPFTYYFLARDISGVATADRIWFAQCKVIRELADKEACVIVGRCADYLLKGREDCFHVFIYAPEAYRMERIVKEYGESNVKPQQRIREKDKKRKLNYKYFTGCEWGNVENYNLCIDSSAVGVDMAVELILSAVKA